MLRKPRRMMNQINVVPYIDVILVLLVIFMVTAPMVNPGQVDLPTMGQSLSQPQQPMQVTLQLDGTLSVLDPLSGGGESTVTRGDLLNMIENSQQQHPDQPVVIAADRKVRYEEVMQVMDLLKRAHVKRIGLLARSTSG